MSFTPRTAKIPLFSGDYQQRVEMIDADLETARKAAEKAKSLAVARLLSDGASGEAEDARVTELEAEREALTAEAEANGEVITVTVQALGKKDGVPGRKRWSQLVSQHPPRDGDDVPATVKEADGKLGANEESLAEALVPMSVVEVSDPNQSVEDLLDNVSSAQFDLLFIVALSLNRTAGSNPKAQRRSQPSPNGDGTEN
jgi:hypothetical protein